MSERRARLVFWIGGVVCLASLFALEVNAHRHIDRDVAAELDVAIAEGRAVYQRHRCGACHSVLGTGATYAPDLTHASLKVGERAIRARLADGAGDDEDRRMPHKPLAPEEIDRIVGYLSSVARMEARELPPGYPRKRLAASLRRAAGPTEPGAALVEEYGCLGCHAVGDSGGHRGPRLEEIAMRRDAAFVAEYVTDPSRFEPRSSMPPFATVPKMRRLALGEFVASLRR